MPEASRKRRTRLAELPPAQKRACLPHSPSPAARSQTAFISERSRHVTTAEEARPASAVRAFPGREAAAGSAQLRLGPGGSGTALPADAAGLRAGGRSRRRAPKERSSRRRSVPPGPPEGRAAPGPPAPLRSPPTGLTARPLPSQRSSPPCRRRNLYQKGLAASSSGSATSASHSAGSWAGSGAVGRAGCMGRARCGSHPPSSGREPATSSEPPPSVIRAGRTTPKRKSMAAAAGRGGLRP